jgi:beta-lactamase class A
VITALPPPPAIEQPAPYQLSYGLVSGVAAAGTRRVIVRVGHRALADMPLRQRHFQLQVTLPTAETTVHVVTVDGAGRRSGAAVQHVLGAPAAAAPRDRGPRPDAPLAREVRQLVDRFGSASAVYVENLVTGAGTAWNARAVLPGASALKLAVAVTALARTGGPPAPGTTLDLLLRRMLIYSDNEAANATEAYLGGSTLGGSSRVNSMLRSLGLVDSDMYGGYEPDELGEGRRFLEGGLPLTVNSQPSWGKGKRTSAYDLASLLRAVWLASAGRGRLPVQQPGFTQSDARYLLYLLANVEDHGKIDRFVGRLPGVQVLHKAGWISSSRHDNGIVLWPGGALLVTVMTYRPAGAGVASDVLAGEVAAAALRRFRS